MTRLVQTKSIVILDSLTAFRLFQDLNTSAYFSRSLHSMSVVFACYKQLNFANKKSFDAIHGQAAPPSFPNLQARPKLTFPTDQYYVHIKIRMCGGSGGLAPGQGIENIAPDTLVRLVQVYNKKSPNRQSGWKEYPDDSATAQVRTCLVAKSSCVFHPLVTIRRRHVAEPPKRYPTKQKRPQNIVLNKRFLTMPNTP